MIETRTIGGLTVLHDPPAETRAAPVLLVHGYLADASTFEHWLPFFAARGVPAYAVNLRGRAGSRMNVKLGHVSIDDYVEDASSVARTVGAHAVIGHSMGGLIAQRLAERGDVRAAVLITPAPPRGIRLISARLIRAQLKQLPAVLLSRVVQPAREDLRELALNCVPAHLQDQVLDRLVPDSGRAGREMSLTGVPVDASRITCPMFVVASANDHFIPSRIVERIAQRYGAQLHTAKNHGHMIVLEPEWERLADIVERWLRAAAPSRNQ